IKFADINLDFFNAFQNYLADLGLNNTTIAKQLSTVKTFLNHAANDDIAFGDKWKQFKISRQQLEVIALTSQEFEMLCNHQFENKTYEQVRDVFIFSCVTGLRYSDLHQLKRDHIKADVIKLTIKKTKDPLIIPLNRYSRAILEKYKDYPAPFPMLTNQAMNRTLHKVCEEVKINEAMEKVRYSGKQRTVKECEKWELITVHSGRKTFCTLSLEKGM